MKRLAVFASGNGSNFEAIAKYKNEVYEVKLLICDQKDAYAFRRAERLNIPFYVVNFKDYKDKASYETEILKYLKEYEIDFIALAGYMRLIGDVLLSEYDNKIVNIHPSLLPAFPGLHAIEQAINYGVKVTGVTIHYIDEAMDRGKIIAQKSLSINNEMSIDDVEKKIHKIEHLLYKKVLEEILRGDNKDEKSID
ncbi:phosphoribosylglycinamide formyltransferase [Mycoplasmatota bacterium]|nr:phosphoribosylglycinamide formyltransferase [Mycoplasmatota bacterium]